MSHFTCYVCDICGKKHKEQSQVSNGLQIQNSENIWIHDICETCIGRIMKLLSELGYKKND